MWPMRSRCPNEFPRDSDTLAEKGLGRRRTGTRQDSSARDVFEDETDICIERENARRLGEMACKGRHGRRSSWVELLVYSTSIFLLYLILSYSEAIEQKSTCGDRSSVFEVVLVYLSVLSMAELQRNERRNSITSWWFVTTQFWEVLLISLAAQPIRSTSQIISVEFPLSSLRTVLLIWVAVVTETKIIMLRIYTYIQLVIVDSTAAPTLYALYAVGQ